METYDGANKKPFKATGLLNKSQLKLASYIKANKDVTLQGTKRFMDKSGEYYLKNINLQNSKQLLNSTKTNSLNNPQNLENILNGNIGKIRKRASKIVTLLPENSLTPIPKKEGINKLGMANGYGKKELNDAQRTAVFIRRLEYATSMKKQMDKGKNLKNNEKKIELIQQWWKTMYKIIKLQKNVRGFLFRKKLMNNLEHQEKLLKFITDFDNIHNYHVYKQFMDNLKRKRDYEKAKLMEKCEDFNDKLDNLERLHNLKNFKNCFEKWKNDTKKQKKQDLDNLAKKLNDVLTARKNKNNLDTLRTIKDKTKTEEDKLNDKAKNFAENNAKKKFLQDLIKAHRLNKALSNAKKGVNDRQKKDVLDTLKKNADLSKALDKLNKLMEDKMKKDAFDDLKTMDFVDKVDDVINKHNDKINDEAKKDFLDKLKDIRDKGKLRDKLKQWKDFNDEMKNRNKILNKLKRYKENELKKKAEQEKNKFAISSGVNDFELISDKPETPRQVNEITPHSDLNFEAKPAPKMEFQTAGQNFSLIAPEVFEFGTPADKFRNLDIKPISNQLDNLDKLNNEKKRKEALENLAKKLNDILPKAKKESDDQMKKDVLDKLKNLNDIAKAVEKLDNLFNTKPKKDVLDKLKKNADDQKALEDLNKLLEKKLKQKFLDNLKKNRDEQKALEKLGKVINNNLKKQAFDDLKRLNNIGKAAEALDKLINDKLKKDAFNDLKDKYKKCLGTDKLEKLLTDKLKRKFLDRLLDRLDDNDKMKSALDKWKDIVDRGKIKDALVGNARKKKALDKWKDIADRRKILDKLKNNLRKNKSLGDILKNLDNKKLKDYFDRWNENAKPKKKAPKSKRISRRNKSASKRNRTKGKKNKDKKLLKQAFDKWRENSSFEPTRNVLEKLKSNKINLDKLSDAEKEDLLQKYKNKMMQVLLNIYKRQRNLLLKKYLDKWRKAKNPDNESEIEEPKYKKKPRINDKKEFSESETDSFNPKYYNPKTNLYKKNIPNMPYKKRYAKMPYEQPEEFKKKEDEEENKDEDNNDIDNNNDEDMDNIEEDNNNDLDNNIDEDIDNDEDKYKYNLKPLNKEDYSDTSSNNESIMGNGEKLIQNRKVIAQPRNYTSQSFFIDKNNANNIMPTNYQMTTHNTNQLPMTMKGDFVSLLEQNPKLINQKNPRIQVTNATCDLKEIMNNGNEEDDLNSEEVDNEMDKLNNNFVIDKNKVLSKVIQNCDKDLYASQKPFKSKKDPWYSVSIPLNDNEAKWEFLNNIKGERDKNNLNKFELIQKETEPIKEENEEPNNAPYSIKTFKSVKNNNNVPNQKDNSYKLREMNFSQFYRSPMRTPRVLDDEKFFMGSRGKRPDIRIGTLKGLLNSSSRMRNDRNNNIDRSRLKIEFDPKYKSIDYENGVDFDSYE